MTRRLLRRPGWATGRRFGWFAAAATLALLAGGLYAWSRPADARSALIAGRYAAAERMLTEAAEAGDAEAMTALGNLYYLGLGRPRDYSRAARLYLAAALAGDMDAQVNISHLYRQGAGVPVDPLRSFGWMLQARASGNETAENHIKWLTSRVELTASQMMYVKRKFPTVASLDPARADPGE